LRLSIEIPERQALCKDKFPSHDGTNASWCEDAGWVEHEENKVASTFEKELEDIIGEVEKALLTILLSEGRTSKHPPYTWLDEPQDEHLRKASRHITTYQLIRDGQSLKDGEDHLHNAITRLSMAIAQREILKRKTNK